ncbi:MAG TPA: flagellar hook-basal body complex protein FliE [Clostridia bacterium]|nr:flagellar hook-basal body complex protein FliE [Clostridia bacterium]
MGLIDGLGTGSVPPVRLTTSPEGAAGVIGPKGPSGSGKPGSPVGDFASVLKEALTEGIEGAARLQDHADAVLVNALAGGNVEIHDVVLATEKAKLALELLIQIRNKAIESYQEIMRMQV